MEENREENYNLLNYFSRFFNFFNILFLINYGL